MIELLLLCGFAFLAGVMDTIVGAGGLVQIPALFMLLPQPTMADVLGTHKFVSTVGTFLAVHQYARQIPIRWRPILPALVPAFGAAFLGARTVSLLPTGLLRPVIVGLLIAVALFTFLKKDFGAFAVPKLPSTHQRWWGIGLGVVLGFYDGCFGLGAGSLLIFAFIALFGVDFLAAAASARVVNLATNVSALLAFASTHHILYLIALPLSVCNVLGALTGAKCAAAKGTPFVRGIFLTVVTTLIIKLAYDLWYPS